jgi:hypothetical protein
MRQFQLKIVPLREDFHHPVLVRGVVYMATETRRGWKNAPRAQK